MHLELKKPNKLVIDESMDRPNGGVQRMQPSNGRYSYAMNSWMQALVIQCLLPTYNM
jgi:hypothetical protein